VARRLVAIRPDVRNRQSRRTFYQAPTSVAAATVDAGIGKVARTDTPNIIVASDTIYKDAGRGE
jgi:hypothetical protein